MSNREIRDQEEDEHVKRDTDGTPLALVYPYPGARRREWRRGYENTGHRCEDAPCCGCCD